MAAVDWIMDPAAGEMETEGEETMAEVAVRLLGQTTSFTAKNNIHYKLKSLIISCRKQTWSLCGGQTNVCTPVHILGTEGSNSGGENGGGVSSGGANSGGTNNGDANSGGVNSGGESREFEGTRTEGSNSGGGTSSRGASTEGANSESVSSGGMVGKCKLR